MARSFPDSAAAWATAFPTVPTPDAIWTFQESASPIDEKIGTRDLVTNSGQSILFGQSGDPTGRSSIQFTGSTGAQWMGVSSDSTYGNIVTGTSWSFFIRFRMPAAGGTARAIVGKGIAQPRWYLSVEGNRDLRIFMQDVNVSFSTRVTTPHDDNVFHDVLFVYDSSVTPKLLRLLNEVSTAATVSMNTYVGTVAITELRVGAQVATALVGEQISYACIWPTTAITRAQFDLIRASDQAGGLDVTTLGAVAAAGASNTPGSLTTAGAAVLAASGQSASQGTQAIVAQSILALAGVSNTPGALATASQGSLAASGLTGVLADLSVAGDSAVALVGQSTSIGSQDIAAQATTIFDGVSASFGALLAATTGGFSSTGVSASEGALELDATSEVSIAGQLGLLSSLDIVGSAVFEESPDKGFIGTTGRARLEFFESDYRPTKAAGGINGAIRDFRTGIYTVLRTPRGTIDEEGEYVAQTSGVFTTDMVVQPGGSGVRGGGRSGGKELQTNPEGQSAEDERLIFTTEELFTRTPTHDPDVVIIKDEPYKVERVKEWEAFGSSHYEIYACRMVIP